MLAHALMPEDPAATPRPVTYGELLAAAQTAVQAARDLASGPPLDPETVRAEFLGYRRLLGVCGIHLGLLSQHQSGATAEQRQLITRLTTVHTTLQTTTPGLAPATGAWAAAAPRLGAAHDLLATHLDATYRPRTAEAEELLTPTAVLPPIRDITGLVVEALDASDDLLRLSATSRRTTARGWCLTRNELRAVREKPETLMPYAKAALLDANHALTLAGSNPAGAQRGTGGSPLAGLESAVVLPHGPASGLPFESTLQALRILRHLTYRQAHGLEEASPASLRDLALLGASLTDPELMWLPPPATPLQRLDRAQARDVCAAAQTAWTTAADDLARSIIGTTRAPRLYADTIHHLQRTDPSTPSLRLALLAALPRLGQDAAAVVGQLHRSNALVAKQREPGHLRLVWRPITPAAAEQLTEKFREAALAADGATAVVRRLTTPSPRPGLSVPTPVRTRGRGLELSRSETR